MKKLLSIVLAMAVAFTLCIPVWAWADEGDTQEITFPSFVSVEGGTQYYYSQEDYDGGVFVTGFAEIDGAKYYFSSEEGFMATGLTSIGDAKYYFSKKALTRGQMKTGWVTINGEKRYFLKKGDSRGQMKTGLATIGGNKYYFSKKTGILFKGGFKTVGKYRYYFGKKTGKARKGWLNSTYYFNKYCHMVKGWKTINDKKYYFSKKTGKKFTGLHKIGTGESALVCTFSKKGVLQRKLYASKKSICLTFDDGPAPSTGRVLDTLEDYNAKATFFMVGNRCASYQSACKRVTAEGHQVACHTYSHPWLAQLSGSSIKSEMNRGKTAIKKYTGVTPTVCRTPGGQLSDTIRSNVGMPIILWSVDTMDWSHHDPAQTLARVKSGAKDGAIILMHDLHSTTADAVPSVCKYLSGQGYQMVTIEEMTLLKGRKLKAGSVYYSF